MDQYKDKFPNRIKKAMFFQIHLTSKRNLGSVKLLMTNTRGG